MVRSLDMPGAEVFLTFSVNIAYAIGTNLGPARSNPKWNYGARSWRFPTQEDLKCLFHRLQWHDVSMFNVMFHDFPLEKKKNDEDDLMNCIIMQYSVDV